MSNVNDILKEDLTFANRYKLIRNLGNGGFSQVWLADDIIAKIQVAIKIYVPDGSLDEEGAEMFRHEFSVVCNMNQTNLLRPFTFDIFDNHPYLVLPYCEKGSSSKLIGKMSEDELWKYLYDVASGLEFLHNFEGGNIIHQDIKPENILITSNHYVITDFGISTKIRRTIRTSKNSDFEGGTIAYMGPERFGSKPDPIMASDIWSLGATLFEIITGQPPFGEHGGLLQKNGADIPEIEADFSSELKEIIRQCLAKETWERPTAKDIKEVAQLHNMGFSMDDAARQLNSRLSQRLSDSLRFNAQDEPQSDVSGRQVGNPAPAAFASIPGAKDENTNQENTGKKLFPRKWLYLAIAFIVIAAVVCVTFIVSGNNQEEAVSPKPVAAVDKDGVCCQELSDNDTIIQNAESKRNTVIDYEYEADYIRAFNNIKGIEQKYSSNISSAVKKDLSAKKKEIGDSLKSFSNDFQMKARQLNGFGATEAADKFISRSKTIKEALK